MRTDGGAGLDQPGLVDELLDRTTRTSVSAPSASATTALAAEPRERVTTILPGMVFESSAHGCSSRDVVGGRRSSEGPGGPM